MSIEVEDFLEHYGVKGMKWGVRKQPETANLRSRISARQTKVKEAKAAAIEVRANKTDVRIRELQREIDAIPGASWKKQSYKSQVKTLTQLRDEDRKYAEKIRKSRLTPTQKKVLIGAAVVGTASMKCGSQLSQGSL